MHLSTESEQPVAYMLRKSFMEQARSYEDVARVA